ncbi:MAG: glycosyl hydrolase family 28-related protein [Steroidobacter sp.]
MKQPPNEEGKDRHPAFNRRTALTGVVSGLTLGSSFGASSESVSMIPHTSGWLNVRTDFDARGDGEFDDFNALQRSIDTGSEKQCPVFIPPGCYKIRRPLVIPSNTMLFGSSLGMGFGCRIEPIGCAAFVIGGAQASFHCSIENMMIWPKGDAPEFIISIDNSYSTTFRNIRIHETQTKIKRAAIVLLGDAYVGGHGHCNNIIWDNLVVRNDGDQPGIAVLASKGCGSHRFISPCLENFETLLEWQGGQIDLITPYTERAGRYGINCNIDSKDDDSYLNTFGGSVNTANSGLACAIRASTRNFNSFGTLWGGVGGQGVYVYELPRGAINFHGVTPNMSKAGHARYAGVPGWHDRVSFPSCSYKSAKNLDVILGIDEQHLLSIDVPGVKAGEYFARAALTSDLKGIHMDAYVSKDNEVSVVLWNPTKHVVKLNGMVSVSCELM